MRERDARVAAQRARAIDLRDGAVTTPAQQLIEAGWDPDEVAGMSVTQRLSALESLTQPPVPS